MYLHPLCGIIQIRSLQHQIHICSYMCHSNQHSNIFYNRTTFIKRSNNLELCHQLLNWHNRPHNASHDEFALIKIVMRMLSASENKLEAMQYNIPY